MKTLIHESLSLNNIEKIIKAELSGKELWGDIPISKDEYQAIKKRIRTLLEMGSVDVKYICCNFPCSMITFMIFLIRYEYNVNFWGLMSQELGVNIYGTIESEIGQCARSTFTKYGFDFSDVKEERRINLEPIMYEAGRPPQSSLDDLFYILKYDTYSAFDPQLIIEDLIEMRSYHIRKPMLRFLKRFKADRALEFVLEVHDAMLAVDQNMQGDSRYIANYAEWKEQEKSKDNTINRKKQEFQTRPYLTFENGKRGLCLVLPRTIMKEEWIDEVEWIVTGYGLEPVHKRMSVFGDEGRRFVEAINVPVSPANHYQIALYDCEGVETDKLMEWTIDGITPGKALFFNANGRMVTPNYLPMPYSVMVFPTSVKILESKHITLSYQAYPTDREGYSFVAIEPTGRDAELKYFANGSSHLINMRPQIDMYFEGQNLFSLTGTHLFTMLPDLIITVDEGTNTNGFHIRIGKEFIDISESFSQGKAVIALNEYRKILYSQFGTYGIRLYQYDHFLKQIEFSYVPKIKTDYSPIMRWPDRAGRREKKRFHFERTDDWQLEFQNCVVSSDEKNYLVECPTDTGVIPCVLKSTAEDGGYTCKFEFPINPFEIDILDSQGMIQEESTDKQIKLGLDDIKVNSYWISLECFGEYKRNFYKLKLRTANGIEQEEYLNLSYSGCGNFNLMAFYDTLNGCPLPAQIELWCNEDEERILPLVIITDTLEMNVRPRYQKGKTDFLVVDIKDDNKDITVKRFGVNPCEITIPYEKSRLGKSKLTRGYPCIEKLNAGLYVVEGTTQQLDFIFGDDLGVELTNGKNTIYISDREKGMPITTVSDWLDQLMGDIVAAGVNKDIYAAYSYKIMPHLGELDNAELTTVDYELLAALAYFIDAKCVEAKKEGIRHCMRTISKRVLNGKKRLELVRLLADMNCPQEIFDICLQEYNLLLFEKGVPDSKLLAEKIENNSTELSLLLLMGVNETVWNTIRRDKYLELIGKEAIKNMLSVPDEQDPSVVALEQKKFLREYSPCRVRINLTSEIAGDMEPIQQMIEITHKYVKFNIAKKPDFGIYFDRIRYVDQYVNWYALSHDKNGTMHKWKRDLMMNSVQAECGNILQAITELKKMGKFGKVVKRYEEALRARFKGDPQANLSANNYARYFYLQGLAAFLVMLPVEYRKYGWPVRTGERFMADAISVAPRISRRDLVMASAFIYLVGKEEQLCQ